MFAHAVFDRYGCNLSDPIQIALMAESTPELGIIRQALSDAQAGDEAHDDLHEAVALSIERGVTVGRFAAATQTELTRVVAGAYCRN